MKKLFALLAVTVLLVFGTSNLNAQTSADTTQKDTTNTTTTAATDASTTTTDNTVVADEERSFHQELKEKFIEGDPIWMAPVLICMILGLAICIERVITLNLATTNTKKFLNRIENALQTGGVEAAKDLCVSTRGPVASIFAQGLMRMSEGVDMVEKSIVAYGSVEMGRLERGLIWISLFIALAPMLGFLGTVVGMIYAFDQIAAAGDMSPALVAGGIKVALLTTVFGLIVAIILQVLYNYCVSKIDGIVNDMEDASISLVDMLVKYKLTNKI
jgi:biopolymer transport protein ExbB